MPINDINNYLSNIIDYSITSNDKIIFEKCSLATIVFYTCKNSIQLLSGKIGINSSKSLPLVISYGFLTTLGSICITHSSIPHVISVSNKLFNDNNENELSYFNQISNSIYRTIYGDDKHMTQKDYLKHIGISIGFFTLLERNYFKTSIPSSLITIGVHANNRGSVIATSDIATDNQRQKIQLLGKKYGCHHCSSKQLLSKKTFIADHMPPTKIAKEMNLEWWRKYFNITVVQRLFPQCQECFQMQGQAVKQGVHKPIYQFGIRLYHFAPALSILLFQNKWISKKFDYYIDI